MRRILFLFLCALQGNLVPAQNHSKNSIAIEPGIFLIGQKSWFFGSRALEKLTYAGGINIGIRKGDRHGLQISPMLSLQQGIVINPPCTQLIPPCSPQVNTVIYFKLPICYRYTFFMNDVVILKAFAGPQASVYIYPSKIKPIYNTATLDAAAGFEICHYVSGNLYINYGFRFDYSLTKPAKYDVLDEFGGNSLPAGSSNANMTAGLIVGADFLLERKIKKKSLVKPGGKATGR